MSSLGWPDGPAPRGGSPVIVMVPSLGTTSRLFDGLADELSLRYPDASLVRADLPGHGVGPPADSVSIEELADDLIRHVTGAGTTRALVIGVSMGGAIALEAARRHPQQIAGFVQINSGVTFGSPDGWESIVESVKGGGTDVLRAPSEHGWFTDEWRGSAAAQALLEDLRQLDDASFIACCAALARYDGSAGLADIRSPALLIGTADDVGTPSRAMRGVAARLGRGEFFGLPAGRHLSVVEHHRRTARHIAEWATRNALGGGGAPEHVSLGGHG